VRWIVPCALALALVLPPAALSASPSALQHEATLPGTNPDVLAAAARLERDDPEPASGECRLCLREHAPRWAPGLALAAAALTVDFAADAPGEPRWDTRNHFDDAISDGLAAGSRSGRDAAATASTVLISVLGAALAGDVYLLRNEYDVEQSLAVALTATAATQLTSVSAKAIAARERPYVRRCGSNPDYSKSCDSDDDNAGFLSLHASQSATLASLLCVRHLRRADRTWTDGLVCGAAAATSAATGILRIAADEHYATDVLAGWGAGALFGTALPLLFPGWSGMGDGDTSVTPLAGGFGLQITSSF
jgi:membrane-associated phospholipid phosphatase